MTDTLTVFKTVIKYTEIIAIEPVQAIKSTKPHKTAAILQNAGNVGLGQAIVCGETCKTKIRVFGKKRNEISKYKSKNN
jgi:hypothetical protein